MTHMRNVLLVYVTVASLGCGALFNADTQTIRVRSEGPITVDGLPAGDGPKTFSVTNHKSHVIEVDGKSCQLIASVGIQWVILDLLASGILPIVIDIVTDSWRSIDPASCSL